MIIFTDLDNCLLDYSYSATSIRDFIHGLIKKGIVISIISSKTSAEIDYFFKEMEFSGPYGAENGGFVVTDGKRIELGVKSEEIKNDLRNIAEKQNVEIELFSEMNSNKITELTGLPDHLIPLAKDRLFSEPFRFASTTNKKFLREMESLGYSIYWGGNLYQIYKNTSKGKAARTIKKEIKGFSIGIGDSPNDYSMLNECDYPILLKSNGNKKYKTFDGFGPMVWKKAVKEALEDKNV
jgi:mannosyl-3-phosphoglycerate phosphatase family protein